MKKCPYCAEEIQDDAIKCKHCGEMLNKKKQDKSLLQQVKNNFSEHSKCELVFWVLISLSVIIFGSLWGMLGLSIFIGLLIILCGVIAFKIEKIIVLTLVTLFFLIGTFSLQTKSLNKQIEDFDFSKQAHETAYRPYLSINMAKPQHFSEKKRYVLWKQYCFRKYWNNSSF